MDAGLSVKCVGCNSPHKANLDEFGPSVGKPLGKGAYGVVRKHRSAKHGDVAIKTMLSAMKDELQPDMIREISALTVLSPHPDIIQLLGWALPDFATNTGSTTVALELGQMSLSDAIRERRVGGDTPETKMVMFQLLRGIAHMNSLDIWHRDIKPGNVIVKGFHPYPDVKIADFGLSRAGPFCYVTPTEVMYTLWYRPPEILIREALRDKATGDNYDEKAEVWALGIVFWDLLAARLADVVRYHLRGRDVHSQLWRLLRAWGAPKDRGSTPFGWEPRRLMGRLVAGYSAFRDIQPGDGENLRLMGNLDVKGEAWDLLSQMLALNAERRTTIYDALNHPYFAGVREQLDSAPIPEPLDCFAGLAAVQKIEPTGACLDAIPGAEVVKKLDHYARVTALMLAFIPLDAAHPADVGVYPLAVQLMMCMLGTPAVQIPDFRALAVLGLSCMSLAGKYYARRPFGVQAFAHAMGGGYQAKDIAQYEALIFQTVGGQLHLPTSYRMLVALVGCPEKPPTTPEEKMHASVFAWAVGLLFLVLTTKAGLAGTPSELAMLATQLSTHYHNRYDVAKLPGCCAKDPQNALCVSELIKGAHITYLSFRSFAPKTREMALDNVSKIIGSLSPFPVEPLTTEGVLAVLEGKGHVVVPDWDETVDDQPPAPPVKRLVVPRSRIAKKLSRELARMRGTQTRGTQTRDRPAHQAKKPRNRPLLSPDITFSEMGPKTARKATHRLPPDYLSTASN